MGETTNKNEITRLVRSRIGLTSTTRIHYVSREGKLIINGEENEIGRFTPSTIEKLVRKVVESVVGKLKRAGSTHGFNRYANEMVEHLVLVSPDALDIEVKPLRRGAPPEGVAEEEKETAGVREKMAAVGGRVIKPSEETFAKAGREPEKVGASEETGKTKVGAPKGRKPKRPLTLKEKVQVAVALAVGLPLAFFAIYFLVTGSFPISFDGISGGTSGGPFSVEWSSPYPCTYYVLDSTGERYTEYTANFYVKIEQDGDTAWTVDDWVEIVSYRTVPEYSLGPDYPPLSPVPHPLHAGYYSSPLTFDSRNPANLPLPYLGIYQVTISGNTLTAETPSGVGGVTLRKVFKLFPKDERFDYGDTLYVTLTTIGTGYVGDESDQDAIVLVKQ